LIARSLYAKEKPVFTLFTLEVAMDTALARLHDRLAALEQENATLRSRLQSCERSHAILQAEVAQYQRHNQDGQELSRQEATTELVAPSGSSLEHRLLETTAAVAHALLTLSPLNVAINTALQMIGECLETDRVAVIENFDVPSNRLPSWRMLYEWNAPHIPSQLLHFEATQGRYEDMEEWYEQFMQGQSVSRLLDDMPEELRVNLEKVAVKATHIVPIFVEGQFWGILGFDDCEEAKQRSAAELFALKIAANCIGSAIQRDRTQQALLQAEQERSHELEHINVELQQALDLLAESEHRYRTLFELSSEGILRWGYKQPIPLNLSVDEQLELCYRSVYIAEGNDAFANMYGYEKADDLIGLTMNDFHDRSSEVTQATMRAYIEANHSARSTETIEFDRYGRKRYFLNSAVSTIENDCVTSTWISQVDITELREAQQALLEAEQKRSQELERLNAELQQALDHLSESEEQFRTLFELSSEGFYYTEVDPPCPINLPIEEQCDLLYRNIRVVKANPAFAAMYGVNHPDELIGLRNADVHVPDSEKNAAFIRGTIENGYRYHNLETEEVDTQGRLHYFLNNGVYTIRNGCVVSGWGTQIDITELRETQQALLQAEQARSQELEQINAELQQTLDRLAESEKRYRTLFELSNEGIYRFELNPPVSTALPIEEQVDLIYQNYRYAEINSTFTSMLGLQSATEAIGKSFADFFDDLESNREGVHAAVVNGYQIRNAEAEEMDANGQRRYMLWNTVSEVHDGYVWGGWGMQTDITELREAQQALLETEQERAAELAKANEALRRSARNIAQNSSIEDILPSFLREAIAVSGASAGAVLRRVGASEFEFVAILQGDDLIRNERLKQHPFYNAVKQVSREDPTGWFTRLAAGETLWRLTEDNQAGPMPECDEYHRPHRQQSVWDVPYRIGDRVAGYLGLAFQSDEKPSQIMIETVTALATQVGLALELTELAEEAKQAAIAREQEKAALERAAELVKANDALKRSLDALALEPSLDNFLGQVLTAIAEQLQAPQVEHWYHLTENRFHIGLIIQQGAIFNRAEIAQLYPDHPGIPGVPVPRETQDQPIHQYKQYFIRDNFDTPLFRDHAERFALGLHQELTLPLVLGEMNIGMLVIRLPRDHKLTNQQIELAQALAHQATLAVRLTQLTEEVKQTAIAREQEKAAQERAAELAKANEALKRSLSSLAADQSLDRFLENVMVSLAGQFNSTTAEYWSHPDGETAYLKMLIWEGQLYTHDEFAEIHPDHPGLAGYKVPPEMVFAEPLDCRTQHFIIEDSPTYPDRFKRDRQWMYDHGIPKEINVPLNVGDHTVGAFVVRMQQDVEITTEKVELAWALAHQVALALELTRLAEEAQQAIVLEERNRMAREIHDTLAQTFTSILVRLQTAQLALQDDLAEVQTYLNQIAELARQGLSEARRSVHALRPQSLEAGDLATALSHCLHQITHGSLVQGSFHRSGQSRPLPEQLELELFRIGQEAITNACKHAHACKIHVELTFLPRQLRLAVYDDGQGFTPENLPGSKGFGLMGMHERAQRINGELTIVSQPQQGTQILVQVPLTAIRGGTP
jgi:PAS domain S-box-containing protein